MSRLVPAYAPEMSDLFTHITDKSWAPSLERDA